MVRIDDQEFLMYDFGLEVGDTFQRSLCFEEGLLYHINGEFFEPATVVAVDMIEVNGQPKKRIFFEDWNYDVWIEGIGSTYSFAKMDFCIVDVVDNLECFHRNGVQEYMGLYDDCCPTNLSTRFSDFEASHHTLFPNPISQSQAFKISSLADHAKLSFYDSNGRFLKAVEWKEGMSPEKIGLKSGFYTVLIQEAKGSFRQKLIIQ
jgi:hypothetical protein